MLDSAGSTLVEWGRQQQQHPITPPSRCAALGMVEPELVGLPGKVLTRDAPREGPDSLSIQWVGCSPWCSTDGLSAPHGAPPCTVKSVVMSVPVEFTIL